MFSTKTYLTFIVLIGSVGKAIPEDLFCDKINSLSIDSVLTDFTENELKLWLFIGEDIYDLEPIDKNFESIKVINRSDLKSLNQSLEPPITLSFFTTKSHKMFRLWNLKKGLDFEFYRNRSINPLFRPKLKPHEYNQRMFETVVLTKDMDGKQFGLRFLFYWPNKKRNQTGIKLYSGKSPPLVIHNYWLMTRDIGSGKQIKIINEGDPETHDLAIKVFYQLNGQNITAAFVYQHYWHIFSGRQFCKMKISSDEWLDFCQIKDISNFFIHCLKTTETTKSTPTTLSMTPQSTPTATSPTTSPVTTQSMTTSTTTENIGTNWTSEQSSNKEDNKHIVTIVIICIAIVVIIGWLIAILIITIAYKYNKSQRENQLKSGQTSLTTKSTRQPSLSRASSVQTVDSGHIEKLKV